MEQLRMIHTLGNIPSYPLADGFTVRTYRAGDEAAWTDICKFGLLTEDEGIECWEKYMLSMDNLVPERDVLFVMDHAGNAIATCTAFIPSSGVGLVHMLAAKPEARGHQLGKFMTANALEKLKFELGLNQGMVRLKSDDWRLSAVKAYLQCGFQPVLFDVDMDTRWQAICDKLNIHGIEMLDDNGSPTGVIL